MNTSHIVENLKKEIENFKTKIKAEKVGKVMEVFDGIVKVSGLSDIKSSEMVTFSNGETGVALNLEDDAVGVIILGDFSKIKEGDEVKSTGRILEIPVSNNILGRVVDALGASIDGKGVIKGNNPSTSSGLSAYPIEKWLQELSLVYPWINQLRLVLKLLMLLFPSDVVNVNSSSETDKQENSDSYRCYFKSKRREYDLCLCFYWSKRF